MSYVDEYRWMRNCKVVGLTPGPNYVTPTMALDKLMEEQKPIVVIETGCAECHGYGDEPLLTAREFESVEAAKAHYDMDGLWRPHPQGGEHFVSGQGSVWIMPETIKEVPS